jgi:methylthioribulose-1-phosphate dehydratase
MKVSRTRTAAHRSPYDSRNAEITRLANNLYQKGCFPGGSGSISLVVNRSPFRILITPSSFKKFEKGDGLLIDQCGVPVRSAGEKISGEVKTHIAIYEKIMDASCVIHPHSLNSLLTADRSGSEVIFKGFEVLKAFGIKEKDGSLKIPIIDNTYDKDERARMVTEALLQGSPAVIIRRHGMFVYGKSMDEARQRTELLEFLMEYNLRETAKSV